MMNFSAASSAIEGQSQAHILIVDEDVARGQALADILAGSHVLSHAESEQMAMAYCLETPPDLVILHVGLSGRDGKAFCKKLKKEALTAETGVVFITEDKDHKVDARAVEAGAVDCLIMPMPPAVIAQRIKTQLTIRAQLEHLKAMSMVDGLTGLANRRYFDTALEREWRHCLRTGTSLALMLCDVDHFKPYNDRHGHLQSDACLQAVAEVIGKSLGRPHDIAARFAGDRFACILPNTEAPGALTMARNFRAAIEQLRLPHGASPVSPVVTISAGISAERPSRSSNLADLVRSAETALQKAKSEGRNRVAVPDTITVRDGKALGKSKASALDILVVDDSLAMAQMLSLMLTHLGHRVVSVASNGFEAVNAYRTYRPDLVTMDITMPELDGLAATKAIIGEFPEAKIVIVTGHGEDKMIFKSLKAGAKGYILKPFDAKYVQEVIQKAWKGKAAAEE